jgi:hypothetical protein
MRCYHICFNDDGNTDCFTIIFISQWMLPPFILLRREQNKDHLFSLVYMSMYIKFGAIIKIYYTRAYCLPDDWSHNVLNSFLSLHIYFWFRFLYQFYFHMSWGTQLSFFILKKHKFLFLFAFYRQSMRIYYEVVQFSCWVKTRLIPLDKTLLCFLFFCIFYCLHKKKNKHDCFWNKSITKRLTEVRFSLLYRASSTLPIHRYKVKKIAFLGNVHY